MSTDVHVSPTKWYCAVHASEGIKLKTRSLEQAQKALNVLGSSKNRQAIIPMTRSVAGDPQSLEKSWPGGSAWWHNGNEIYWFQDLCSNASLPLLNVGDPKFLY